MKEYIKPAIEMFDIELEESVLKSSQTVKIADDEYMDPENAF